MKTVWWGLLVTNNWCQSVRSLGYRKETRGGEWKFFRGKIVSFVEIFHCAKATPLVYKIFARTPRHRQISFKAAHRITMLPSAGHWPCDLGTGLAEITPVKGFIILAHVELHIQHGFQRAPGAGAHPAERCTGILDESKSSILVSTDIVKGNPEGLLLLLNKVLLMIMKESRPRSKFTSIVSQWTTCFATWAPESRDL